MIVLQVAQETAQASAPEWTIVAGAIAGAFVGAVIVVLQMGSKLQEFLRKRATDPAMVEQVRQNVPDDAHSAFQRAIGKASPEMIELIGTLLVGKSGADEACLKLEQDLKSALARLDSVERIATGQKGRIDELEGIQMRHTSEIERLQTELEQARAELARAEEELATVRADRDNEHRLRLAAEERVQELSARVAQLEARIAELEKGAA